MTDLRKYAKEAFDTKPDFYIANANRGSETALMICLCAADNIEDILARMAEQAGEGIGAPEDDEYQEGIRTMEQAVRALERKWDTIWRRFPYAMSLPGTADEVFDALANSFHWLAERGRARSAYVLHSA